MIPPVLGTIRGSPRWVIRCGVPQVEAGTNSCGEICPVTATLTRCSLFVLIGMVSTLLALSAQLRFGRQRAQCTSVCKTRQAHVQDILQPTISVLTAMITPAVMISACGTLILSTSQRLSRVIGRVYEWTRWLDAASRSPSEEAFARENAAAFFLQFETTSRRVRLLHWGLSAFYFSLGTFVADMLVIGVIALMGIDYSWPAVGLGLIGAVLMLLGCAALVRGVTSRIDHH